MKVAIVTFGLRRNFGGILQCWALQTAINKLGHSTKIVYWKDYSILKQYVAFSICQILEWITFGGKKKWKKIVSITNLHKFKKFIKKELNLGPKVKRDSDLTKYLDADAFIAGSDQI